MFGYRKFTGNLPEIFKIRNKGRGVLLVPFFFYWSRLHELEKVSKTMGWVEEGGRWHSKRQRCRQEFEVTRASWT